MGGTRRRTTRAQSASKTKATTDRATRPAKPSSKSARLQGSGAPCEKRQHDQADHFEPDCSAGRDTASYEVIPCEGPCGDQQSHATQNVEVTVERSFAKQKRIEGNGQ
jgi:hypothetical protein